MCAAPGHPVAGLVLAPFRGWRYDESVVGDLGAVLSPPNDVLSADEVVDLEARSPWNAYHLNRPPSYAAAAMTLTAWISAGALRQDPEVGLYAYEQVLPDGRGVRGLLGALGLTPPAAGIVLPHEDTRPGPIADRLALMTETGADLEPILVVHDGGAVVAQALDEALAGPLLAQAQTPDGIRHRLAEVTAPDTLDDIAAELGPGRALIADGHHRFATYLRRQREHWAAGDGAGPWDFGLTLLVDGAQSGLDVRPIHRVLAGLPLDVAVTAASAAARITELPTGGAAGWLSRLSHAAGLAFVLAAGDRAFLLDGFDPEAVATGVEDAGGAAIRRLAVTALARYLVPVVLGAEHDGMDVADAARAVELAGRDDGTAILLPPISFHDVLAVAAQGDRMPRKSTLFLPKPASGLVLRRVAGHGGGDEGHLVSEVSSTS